MDKQTILKLLRESGSRGQTGWSSHHIGIEGSGSHFLLGHFEKDGKVDNVFLLQAQLPLEDISIPVYTTLFTKTIIALAGTTHLYL